MQSLDNNNNNNNNDDESHWLTCTSAALADHLARRRFDGNAEATAQFLRAAADAIIAQSIVATEDAMDIGECLHYNDQNDDQNDDNNAVVFVSSLQPRGKLQLTIGRQGTRLGGGDRAAGFMLKPNTVKACVVFPKPEECKKVYKASSAAPDMVCLTLTEAITYKSKPFTVLCFQLPAKPKQKKTAGTKGGDDDSTNGGVSVDHTSKWMVLLQKSLAFGNYERVYHPKHTDYGHLNAFQSHRDDQTSSTSSGMPYVSCYYDSVNDGVVFPLHSGALLFYKPVQFWTQDEMAGPPTVGNTSSRYIGLSFQLKQPQQGDDETKIRSANDTIDLTNISAHERSGLEAFVLDAFGTTDSAERNNNGDRRRLPNDDDTADGSLSNDDHDEDEADQPPPRAFPKHASRKRKAAVRATAINKRVVGQPGGDEDDDEENNEDHDATFDDDDDNDDDDDDDNDDDDDDDAEADTGGNSNDSDKTDENDDDDDQSGDEDDDDSDGE
jgi:hypothetical protein